MEDGPAEENGGAWPNEAEMYAWQVKITGIPFAYLYLVDL